MLKLFELAPSPNNTKVRMALRFKGIPFEAEPVAPMDRARVLEVSGQELTPVVTDRGIVLNDSEAILQYLDANYRDTPRLFPADRAGRKVCDGWKLTVEEKLARPWVPVFFHALGMKPDFDRDAAGAYREALAWFDRELGGRAHFQGPDKPICDLWVAEWASYGLPSPGLVQRVPLFGRTRELFGVGAGSLPNLERFLAPWNQRLE